MIEKDSVKVKSFIRDDPEADFIGTWSVSNPSSGAYAMYVTEKIASLKGFDVKGYMWDTLGFATFTGKIDSNRFEFIKVYDDDAVDEGGLKGEVKYSLKIGNEPGKFEGEYTWSVDEDETGDTWVKAQKFTFDVQSEDFL